MLDLPAPPAWMGSAACRGMPTELWFPERGERPEVTARYAPHAGPVRVP
jgi:hypothetical protein